MPKEQAVEILSTGFTLGIGAIIGAICATIGCALILSLSFRVLQIKNAIANYKDLRKERRESAATSQGGPPA